MGEQGSVYEYCRIDKKNAALFAKQEFVHMSLLYKGRYIGVFLNKEPVAFIAVALKGEVGSDFKIKESDIHIEKLYVFPEYRGRGIAKAAILHCVNEYFPPNKDTAKVSLCVRPDNFKALSCYGKMGFKKEKEARYIRFFRDYIFPKTMI